MNIKEYERRSGKDFALSDYASDDRGGLRRSDIDKEHLSENMRQIFALQSKLFAENKQSLLVVLQAMDAAGKDGLIKHVFSGLNPQGVHVTSFTQPSSEELDHDYLWRIARALPRRGDIGVFNRSHYEEVIVAKVHDLIQKQQLPERVLKDKIWKRRYRQINDFERHLYENGVTIIKFFLHLSKEEQKERLLARIDEPHKNWKFAAGDLVDRKRWDDYQDAYEQMITHTATDHAPWYIIPADRKWYARYLASEIVLNTLEGMDPKYPKVSEEQKARLQEYKAQLENE